MPIDDPAEPQRNRITEVAEETTNGTSVTDLPSSPSVAMSLPELVKLLGSTWKTVILAVANNDGSDTVAMVLKHGQMTDALKLCGSLSAAIQNGV